MTAAAGPPPQSPALPKRQRSLASWVISWSSCPSPCISTRCTRRVIPRSRLPRRRRG